MKDKFSLENSLTSIFHLNVSSFFYINLLLCLKKFPKTLNFSKIKHFIYKNWWEKLDNLCITNPPPKVSYP